MLYDIEARIRMMDQWPAYQQVLTLSNPHHTFIKRGEMS